MSDIALSISSEVVKPILEDKIQAAIISEPNKSATRMELSMTRKITQIAVCGVERTEFTQCSIVTVALCDDGTVWHLYNEHEGWYCQPNVPQKNMENYK